MGLLYLIFAYVKTTLLPEQIKQHFKVAPVDKLLSIEDLTVLAFTRQGVHARFAATVVKTKPPEFLSFLRASVVISGVEVFDASDGERLVSIALSDPIDFDGRTDLKIRQDKVDVEVVGVERVKGIVRRVEIGGKKEAERVTVKIAVTLSSITLWGWTIVEGLTLVKELNVGKLQAAKEAALAKYQAEEKAALEAAQAAEAETKAAMEAAAKEAVRADVAAISEQVAIVPLTDNGSSSQTQDNNNSAQSKPDEATVAAANGETRQQEGEAATNWTDDDASSTDEDPNSSSPEESDLEGEQQIPTSSGGSSGGRDASTDDDDESYHSDSPPPAYAITDPSLHCPPLPDIHPSTNPNPLPGPTRVRIGAESLFPDPILTPLPVIAGLSGITTGLEIRFAAPPALSLTLQSIKFSVHLNGFAAATGNLTNISFSPSTLTSTIGIEIVPSVVARPISGLAGMFRGVLKGAIAGTVSGIMTGDWGSGAAVISVRDIEITDGEGKRVEWVERIMGALELEKDLDAVRQVRTHGGQGAAQIKEVVLGVASGVLDAANRAYGATRREWDGDLLGFVNIMGI
ncbi:hypothetical protein HK104_010378 [Borealophlyctis nickersoniae]|nr:hypothetical protein HK104_010378 [Borealophlyctis nickersoniae]